MKTFRLFAISPVMVASSLTLVNLLSLVRPSLFYALISALDFEDERFSSVRGALVRTLLGASHRAAVDCADDSGERLNYRPFSSILPIVVYHGMPINTVISIIFSFY